MCECFNLIASLGLPVVPSERLTKTVRTGEADVGFSGTELDLRFFLPRFLFAFQASPENQVRYTDIHQICSFNHTSFPVFPSAGSPISA